MITVTANESFCNVAKDKLKGLKLLRKSVFFGINGSGKSTICEVLNQHATLEDDRSDTGEPVKVFAFNEQWRENTVGEFLKGGGGAPGVTTVMLGEGMAELEQQISEAKEQLRLAGENVEETRKAKETVRGSLDEVIGAVQSGELKTLKQECDVLKGKQFNKNAIGRLLQSGGNEKLDKSSLKNNIKIVNTDSPAPLAPLPSLPDGWKLSDNLWEQLIEQPSSQPEISGELIDWLRKGRKLHTAEGSCQFCEGKVDEKILASIDRKIQEYDVKVPELVDIEHDRCSSALEELKHFKFALDKIDFSGRIYCENMPEKQNDVKSKAQQVEDSLEESYALLERKISNPFDQVSVDRPNIPFDELQSAFKELEREHATAQKSIKNHIDRQKSATEHLKMHCCADFEREYRRFSNDLEDAEQKCEEARKAQRLASDTLRDLQSQVSTTAETAMFLDKHLCNILGDRVLRVSEGDAGQGYRITRANERAEAMSEGEKKLVSLLYFCAEFRTEERKRELEHSVVIFDDLGSELDEVRLLVVNRFISDHFSDLNGTGVGIPASIVYFTHSQTYLRILQDALKDKITGSKAVFYEVFKQGESFSCEGLEGSEPVATHETIGRHQNTNYYRWDDQFVELTNDYWFSFARVLSAFRVSRDSERRGEIDPGTVNYCRKVVECFTEFKYPCHERFGKRLDELLKNREASVSPALSKVLNNQSHGCLDRRGGALAISVVVSAIKGTLKLLYDIDEEHLRLMVERFTSADNGNEKARKVDDCMREIADL